MPLKFTDSQQATLNGGIKGLCYGGSGVGKTVLCASLPYPIMLSAESGQLSLRPENIARIYGQNAAGITYIMPIIEIRTVDDLTDAYRWLTSSHESRNFQSVAIDSLSEIGEVVLNNAKRQVKDPRQAYGELIEKMESVVRTYRDLPGKHVYMSAKMEPTKDEMTGVVKYGPSMPGSKLGPKLPYFFDFVFRLGINKTQQGEQYRFLQTQTDLQHEAKDRSGMLQPIEAPHLGYIFNKIFGVA